MSQLRGFQRVAARVLFEGRSALVVAPTGTGKTLAALLPFARALRDGGAPLLGTRLLYALPMRSLAAGVVDEMGKLDPPLTPAVHHGDRPESMAFRERACVTTIDQYLAAFAGAPLSSFTDGRTERTIGRRKTGHAAAGAVLASHSVFDEVHLLDPKYGFQLLMAVLAQRRRWGLASAVLTATMPSPVVRYLTEDADGPGLALVEPSAEDVAARDGGRSVFLELVGDLEEALDVASVVEWCQGLQERYGKVILIANTVDRAVDYYDALRERLGDSVPLLLAHSRFAPEDRERVERRIAELFGRQSREPAAVLVATQVAEVGLDISAPVVLTELCPADSLVQRAGRAARFGGQGRLVVFKPRVEKREQDTEPPYWLPYPQVSVIRTEEALGGFDGVALDWPTERELVDKALGEVYGAWVRGEDLSQEVEGRARRVRRGRRGRLRPIDALAPFEKAFREGSPEELEEWLRNPEGRPAAVQVGVVDSWDRAEEDLARGRVPVTVRVPFGVLRQRYREGFEAEGASFEIREVESRGRPGSSLQRVSQLLPGRTYLILANGAGYSPERGLTFRGVGDVLGWRDLPRGERHQQVGRRQTFAEHCLGTLRRAQRLTAFYLPFLERWASSVFEEINPQEVATALAEAIQVAALFHDVGKLHRRWQETAGWEPGQLPVARFPEAVGDAERRDHRLPPHAPFAYPFLRTLFREAAQATGVARYLRPLDMVALAAARHHSLTVSGAVEIGGFQPYLREPALRDLVEIAHKSGLDIEGKWLRAAFGHLCSEKEYADEAPGPSDDLFPLYCIAQRVIKLADWEDAGGEYIELAR